MYSIVLLLSVLVGVLVIGSSASIKTIVVVPNFRNASHLNSPNIRYFSLQEIMNNQSDFFTSNTVLKLVPGVYHIHRMINLHVTNVTNLVLKSSDNESYKYDGNQLCCVHASVPIQCTSFFVLPFME